MQDKIRAFIAHVTEISGNPEFVHHKWFVQWHLQIVEKMALELADGHPEADRDLVQVMAWLHDYGKLMDFDRQYEREQLDKGRDKLIALGFDEAFANKAADYIELLDKKLEVDLAHAPIEVQIVSTADGCSHMVGPFMFTIWQDQDDPAFRGLSIEQLMEANVKKATKDWAHKIVLPEARAAFEARYRHNMEIAGNLPERYFS